MKLAVYGASGGIGQHIVRLALVRGDEVRAVYRTPPPIGILTHYTPIVAANVADPALIGETITGVDAVIVALGLRRKHPANPWSSLTSPATLTSQFTAHLVSVMQRPAMPKTVIAISAGGVGDSAAGLHPILRYLFRGSNIGRAYADLERMEQIYHNSLLRWMCVRPTTLMDRAGPPRPVRETKSYGLMSRIARVDVAQFILNSAASPTWLGQTPTITYT
jgi:putative NADH-flavin reductase